MKALIFPGQGSQIVGMGSEFYRDFKIAREIFTEADDVLKYKISKIILEGPDDQLKLTKNTQPAILTVSYLIFLLLKKEFGINLNQCKYFAGHSLGEYSALVCSNSLKFKDALYLLHERGIAMQEAVPVGRGGMIAILGLAMNEIEKFILEAKEKGVCEIANDNADGQIIVSGNIEALDFLANNLKKDKKKSIKLPVSAPFHCSLMKSAAEKMNSKIQSTNFNNPKFKIVTNVKAEPEENADIIKKLLVEQIFSKVRWRESVLYMANNGVTDFIEIGPGKVLTGLIKRIVKNVNSNSINTTEDIKNLLNEPKK
jgi:[acyl-carrier-protein] S-malonyltransferase